MRNILVIGSSGFIATHLIARFFGVANIIGFDRAEKIDCSYQQVVGDFTAMTTDSFLNLLEKYSVDIIFHCVSTSIPHESTSNIDKEIEENVATTARLLEAIKNSKRNIRMVFISSGGTIYGEGIGLLHDEHDKLKPICSYGLHKKMTEELIEFYINKFSLDCRIARVSNPYGCIPNQNRTQGIIPIFISKLFSDDEITLYGDTVRDYIYIDDAIEALYKLVEYRGEETVFNIASGSGVLLSDIVAIIQEEAGKKFQKVNVASIRSCDVQENVLNVSSAKNELHWTPKLDIHAGIKKLLQEMRG